jgi:general stress protein 26
MGAVKNLSDGDSVKKIQKLIDSSNVCLFTTQLSEKPLSTRPMGTMKADDDGNIWFFSNSYSNKNREIKDDNRVQLFYSNNGNSEYLSIYGEAQILNDQKRINELWNPIVRAWFLGGKTDPDITIIKVKPAHVYYWDTNHNKMISLLRIFAGAINGAAIEDGVEGKIKL